ncbi:polysaccharide deacetylase family protein [Sphingomonas sp. PAMC 26621]|uniref:polysaccharide deacetylase family protein n=1 Tax=Sphingomonas sp. PAMC 26621 TaxID=1112213 RepID=UPI000287F9C9|nr:polysaccharide deacetylase family protein [Sphingomonas sp. PAMC 26621]
MSAKFGFLRTALRIAAAAGLVAAAVPATAGTVALTFDDLPVFGRMTSAADGAVVTEALLAGLKRQHYVATGFVNERQLAAPDRAQRVRLLARWVDAGMDLGNHSYSHLSLNAVPVEAYIADVAHGAQETSTLLAGRGKRERWYRYPYLETGLTLATRQRFEGWLGTHGYRVAPVTMENSDWRFAAPYDDAIARGDPIEARRIQQAYLDFTARIVPWYQKAGQALLGREPAFVFLLHASRLNAASIDKLAAILRAQHLRVVPLDTAMRDPAYAIPDTYVGPNGDGWLDRWALTLHKSLPYASVPIVPHAILTYDARLEGATDPRAKATS